MRLADKIDLGPVVHEEMNAFLDYWISLSDNGCVPTSRAFVDTPEPRLTPWSFIFEVSDGGTVFCRFMGTAQVELWDMDFTDLDLTKQFPTRGQLNRLNLNHMATYQHPCGLWDLVTYAKQSGLLVKHEQLTLPLSVEDGKPPRTVVFAKAADPHGLSDSLRRFSDVDQRRWVDLGAGVPSDPPLMP